MSGQPFVERLRAASEVNKTWLMIGLDPVLERLPEGISRDADGIVEFNRRIIEATSDLVIGYKPNAAFYEVVGAEGWKALGETRRLIPGNLIALLDAKRGDIGDTSSMYARAIFETLGFDAVTVAPYVGREGVRPFLSRPDRGVFVLCRTSNRDGALQDLPVGQGEPLYEHVAREATAWGPNVGLVVGATDLNGLRRVRQLCPNTPFLVPGVGSQGATAGEAIETGSDRNSDLAIISTSRAILYASSGPDFAQAARDKAQALLREMHFPA